MRCEAKHPRYSTQCIINHTPHTTVYHSDGEVSWFANIVDQRRKLAVAILAAVCDHDHVIAERAIFRLKQTHPDLDWDAMLTEASGE